MKLLDRRREAALAEARLDNEQARWCLRSHALTRYVRAHRTALAVGGGFAGGLLTGLLPLRALIRVGGVAFNAVSFAMRLPGALLVANDAASAAAGNPPASE